MPKSKYTEIFKLKQMLETAEIPFDFADETIYLDKNEWVKFHVYYPAQGKCVCSVIQGVHSYGGDHDLLEIRGLLTEDEEKSDSVKGYLTADDVFGRIKAHWEKEGGNDTP